uniref:Uncharacterized protein n=1 Tax=Anguilla anguilla TaxID=7936 RepID=A0A0E9T5H0_ANGAN
MNMRLKVCISFYFMVLHDSPFYRTAVFCEPPFSAVQN